MEDISPILQHWPYHPNNINVRLIEGADGKKKIQMRLDLGILQMEMDGRPDGKRPRNCDSYLSYYERRLQKAEGDSHKQGRLTPLDCLHLQQESVQYYHRYLALMELQDYVRVRRDTDLNLRIFDLVNAHCPDQEMVWSFEQYRPYVLMMKVRAKVLIELREAAYDAALQVIDLGIDDLKQYFQRHKDRVDGRGGEIAFLDKWAAEIRDLKPQTQRERLQRELDLAVSREEYERAAVLRDQLRGQMA
ncbi:MAG TPA: UvrB/UvrC motif-containing protein [bacterium]|nr:UvrB/UvrC motif-containing protein [bacterium]HNT64449.1 UvrB/UvrC motif-containing protein [bacterium]HOX84704.1 UvrB/UvrC motif-containing protein [bacterium]HPG45427.1 UvrB/UvrC motif-containing protein [bacterium]HPM96797.1 UvrB/UvrC motif-containing protein [bacterium]